LHQTINKVSVKSRKILRAVSPQTLAQKLKGHKFASSRHHGKFLFIELEDKRGDLVLHFGLSGFLKYFKDEEDMPPHTRLLLGFSNRTYVAFDCQRMLGEVDFAEDVEAYIKARGIGPDALELQWERFKERLAAKSSSIKGVLTAGTGVTARLPAAKATSFARPCASGEAAR
jgi:formamidopyrimidine-DNA glycosylase